jgi:hypothetical protein
MEIKDNIKNRYIEALKFPTVASIPTKIEKALYLFDFLGFPKKILCSGEGKIISILH